MSRIDKYHVGYDPIGDEICIIRPATARPDFVIASKVVTDEVVTAVMALMKAGLDDQQLSALEINSADESETWLLVLQKKPPTTEESRIVIPGRSTIH